MALRIQTNITAINAHKNLNASDVAMAKSLERLSSGYRINRAADDAAGLAISEGFRADIASFNVASRNTTEANALLQVAEGGMEQIGNMLTRLKELATQAASANVGAAERTKINAEGNALISEIDRIANSTKYGSTALLDGTFGASKSSTVGAGGSTGMIGTTYNAYTTGVAGGSILTVASIGASVAEGDWSLILASGGITGTQMWIANATTISNATISEKATLGVGTFSAAATAATTLSWANLGITINVTTAAALAMSNMGIYFGTIATGWGAGAEPTYGTYTRFTGSVLSTCLVTAAFVVTAGAGTAVETFKRTGLTSLNVENAIATGTYTFSQPNTSVIQLTNGTNSQQVTYNGPGSYNFSSLGITFNLTSDYTHTGGGDLSSMTLVISATAGSGNVFQIGAKNDDNNKIALSISGVQASTLNDGLVVDQLDSQTEAQSMLTRVDSAISSLTSARGTIGASMNRLNYAAANLATTIQNSQAVDSVIRDVDMASEMTNFTKQQILMQAGTAMLAQANQAPSLILSLLK